ncbi:MAG: outer membrane lipid asymmetry maintenance protein MlaD [Deltaproteobacteria bacterium]|nr:outer membrane lipid asymmetry maintenance protein MlaD [Deltaproteobacteria bacterium]
MKRLNIETAVGVFVILGFLCFAYLSIKLGGVELWGNNKTYTVDARFDSIAGLKVGAYVEIGGVKVGKVASIRLDPKEYEAVVDMSINKKVKLQDDSIASIRTAGIIGDRYVSITPGGSEDYIKPGGEITETESAINLEELVSKYIFEKK